MKQLTTRLSPELEKLYFKYKEIFEAEVHAEVTEQFLTEHILRSFFIQKGIIPPKVKEVSA